MATYNDLPQMVETLLKSNSELLVKVNDLNRKVEGQNEKPILTRKEVSELFSVHINTISNWVKDGLLKEHHKGNKPYYKRDEVLAFIYSQQVS